MQDCSHVCKIEYTHKKRVLCLWLCSLVSFAFMYCLNHLGRENRMMLKKKVSYPVISFLNIWEVKKKDTRGGIISVWNGSRDWSPQAVSYQVRLADRELVHQLSAHSVHEKKYNALRQHKGVPGKCLIDLFCTYICIYICLCGCVFAFISAQMYGSVWFPGRLLAQTVSL